MNTFFEKLRLIIKDKGLVTRIFFTLCALVVFRLLAAIPVPGVDTTLLESFLQGNQFIGLLNLFSGGGFTNLSIIMLGVGAYINASIIMQLLTIMSPRLKAIYQEEGEAGRRRFAQYTRLLSVPLALIQSYGFLLLLQQQNIIPDLSYFDFAVNMLTITAGSVLLMWIGELISEFGIGNGISLIIFAGIVASLPSTLVNLYYNYDPAQLPLYLGIGLAGLLIVYGVVMVTEAERPIPVTYAKRVRGMKVYGGVSTYLPLRLNQAGVIPIIFALSILLLPTMLLNMLSNLNIGWVTTASIEVNQVLQNQWIYAAIYFLLVLGFTYFYTAVTFDPVQLSTNLQKNGAFIPGVRPGQSTALHISRILTRLTLVGALFLGIIAVLPLIMQALTGFTAFAIGGTALLIVISVVLDLFKKINAQISMREY